MNLIIIHGPPAVGKLTVAKALARKTGYKIFHNHLINDLLAPIFEHGSPTYSKLVRDFWIRTLSTAAQTKDLSGIIMTYCYAKGSDDQFMRKVVKAIKVHRGTAYSVLLTCDKKTLLSRIKEDSRKAFSKLKHPKKLEKILSEHDLTSPIPFVKGIIIDNTHLSANSAAQKILSELPL